MFWNQLGLTPEELCSVSWGIFLRCHWSWRLQWDLLKSHYKHLRDFWRVSWRPLVRSFGFCSELLSRLGLHFCSDFFFGLEMITWLGLGRASLQLQNLDPTVPRKYQPRYIYIYCTWSEFPMGNWEPAGNPQGSGANKTLRLPPPENITMIRWAHRGDAKKPRWWEDVSLFILLWADTTKHQHGLICSSEPTPCYM